MKLPSALPSLRGRRGDFVYLAYAVVAAVVITISLGAQVSRVIGGLIDQPAAVHYGFLLGSDERNHPIIGHAWREALTAGVVEGNRIIAIDGVVIQPDDTVFDAGRSIRKATGLLVLDMLDAHGVRSRHRITRVEGISDRIDPETGMTIKTSGWYQLLDYSWEALFFFTLSLLLVQRRRRDAEAMLLAFTFLAFGFDPGYSGWLGELGIRVPQSVIAWLGSFSANIGFNGVLVGLCAFPDGRFASRWSRVAWLLPATWAAYVGVTSFSLYQHHHFIEQSIGLAIYMIVTISVVLRYRTTPMGLERQQIKVAAFGGAVMVLALMIELILAMPAIAAHLDQATTYVALDLEATLESQAFPAALLISLLRYRLYDADAVISRSAAFAGLSMALVAVFAGMEQLVQSIGQDYLGNDLGDFAGGLGAAAAAVMIAPLHRRIGNWAEKHFQPELVRLQTDLPPLIGNLRETATPQVIARTTLDRIDAGLHARHGAIVTDDQLLAVCDVQEEEARAWWEKHRPSSDVSLVVSDLADPLFPLRLRIEAEGAGQIGWLLLGPRPDGSFYGKDERAVLTGLMDPLARALSFSNRREAQETVTAMEFSKLRAELDTLRATLASLIERPR